MQTDIHKEDSKTICINCISGETTAVVFKDGFVSTILQKDGPGVENVFVGPGLIDLQVNGVNGIDFNNAEVTVQEIIEATHFLLSQGITTYLPTVITNSVENICQIVGTIYKACSEDSIVNDSVWGIHLEGPFLCPIDGARGAHSTQHLKLPDWPLFETFQQAAGGKIKLVTIAPELEGAVDFIEKCRQQKILVSLGHSMADRHEIGLAVKAGASLITHFGNAVPLVLPRHPNILWDLLATEELWACIIADGVHIPDSLIQVAIKAKGDKALLVSDATCFAGMLPGEYQNHIGGTVILDSEKRVSLKTTPGLLAGAAKTLLENVETMMDHQLATLADAWSMASVNVVKLLEVYDPVFNNKADLVIFEMHGKKIQVKMVIKSGRIVFEK